MPGILRDFLLSFCPAVFRQAVRPESPQRTLHAATWGGLAQFFLAALAFIVQLKVYFVRRSHELAPYIAGKSEVVQTGTVILVTLEYLLHPLALLSLYLALEGLLRFMAGLVSGEVLPTFLVVLAIKAGNFSRRLSGHQPKINLVPDTVENLPDGRVRIASANAKSNWNASITIGIQGQWFEVEGEEQGTPPRVYVYLLRPAPPGKILRGYEEYDLASALKAHTSNRP
ncbi:MAG TPA: hypothetical protein VFR24_08575 [Candidatus Angelobacter sp.]|nr:hypothetical protein [Candidatus Angelobacter sp.]